MALFDAPTGGQAVNLQSGSPDYQNAIVGNVQRQLAPQYRQALQGTMQGLQGRGLLDSGVNAQARLGLNQNYLGQLANTETEAATKGADVAEQNRRIVQQHQFDVENQQRLLDFQKEMQSRQEQQMGYDRWANLIGGAVGGAGQALGYGLAGLGKGTQVPDSLAPPIPGMDETAAAAGRGAGASQDAAYYRWLAGH